MQKIIPCLWFEKDCEEAIDFYTSLFPNSKITNIQRYPDNIPNPPWGPGMEGKVITAIFELEGQKFMALDGGTHFKFNPTVSFTVNSKTKEESETLWNKLKEGGKVMMEFQEYPFSKGYGWLEDKFGLSWQINTGESKQRIIPSLMFVGDKFGKCEEAINFYTSVFKNSEIKAIAKYEPDEQDEVGKIKYSLFQLEGQEFIAMESSFDHKFKVDGAVSMLVDCDTQEEIDYYWGKLSANPAAEQCGWLQDKYGFSWQINPRILGELLSSPDKEKADRAMKAMLEMKKLDIAELKKAYDGI